ncbi:unnamed protein product [Vitrella brassicaformis CCMP3155]|uniref:SET domain-containing protein n=1 Tax=Vitrella brassicaformis (strain CCMP3155) TaxID=1169540 RepID=A0A0G4F6F6_VITBC|nr:unnamed protein product [Vitrella brassicaformis CCMP3155]|eukprot:CEM07993.1 unnamed protein product [Vitrella brassicaformis CCMP3155]
MGAAAAGNWSGRFSLICLGALSAVIASLFSTHVLPRWRSIVGQSTSLATPFDALRTAMGANDGHISAALTLLDGSEGQRGHRGIVASRAIAANEVLLTIPRKVMLTGSAVEGIHPLVAEVQKIPGLHLKHNAPLQAFMALALDHIDTHGTAAPLSVISGTKEVHSLWEAWLKLIASLPTPPLPAIAAGNHTDAAPPLYASPSLLATLAAKHRSFYAQDHRKILANVDRRILGPRFGLESFMRATALLQSRSMAVANGLGDVVPCGADLLNHAPSRFANARWQFDAVVDSLQVNASRAIAAGEEIVISYGDRSNPQLFLSFGFTLPPTLEPFQTFKAGTAAALHKWEEGAAIDPSCKVGVVELSTGGPRDEFTKLNAHLNAHKKGSAWLVWEALLTRFQREYEKDPLLRPAMEQLRANRQAHKDSPIWWSAAKRSGDGKTFDWDRGVDVSVVDAPSVEHTHAVRVKMSEYLCVTAHLEAIQMHKGVLVDGDVWEMSRRLKEWLSRALDAQFKP